MGQVGTFKIRLANAATAPCMSLVTERAVRGPTQLRYRGKLFEHGVSLRRCLCKYDGKH